MYMKTLLLIISGICSTNAFVVSTSRSHFGVRARANQGIVPMTIESPTDSSTILHSKTRLQYRNQDEDDILYTDSNDTAFAATLLTDSRKIPKSIFLPRLSQDKRRADQLMDAELIIGRIAMMASIVMISSEILAGTSLPDQIYNLLHF
ncbi:hypothetical protein MHU86_17969 [Fragilaria crotonensis]|nr:hypothetical protein MHU86_17969 [Fragilaria crotonensis]